MSGFLDVRVEMMSFPGRSPVAPLIEGLSFSVPKGGIVSFLGPSGSGKTTLLRIIAGLETRFCGAVMVENHPVSRPNRDVQVVFQDSRLLPWLSALENVRFAAGKNEQEGMSESSAEVLKAVGLGDRVNAWPKTLSGGEETRVSFARALVCPPKVLLLDEAFKGLDIQIKYDIQAFLLKFHQEAGATVVHVSHNIEDAVFLSDVVYCVSTRPMTITRTFTVDVPRPRTRGDLRLAKVCEQILSYILGHT